MQATSQTPITCVECQQGAGFGERQVSSGCQIATRTGLGTRALMATAKPAQTTLCLADECDVGLIALGARRHGAPESLRASAFAPVVHQASRPVLPIPGG